MMVTKKKKYCITFFLLVLPPPLLSLTQKIRHETVVVVVISLHILLRITSHSTFAPNFITASDSHHVTCNLMAKWDYENVC